MENWCWNKCLGKCVEKSCWKKCLRKCVEKIMLDKVPGKVLRKLYIRERCLARIVQDCRESDRRSAGSRMQCSKPQLEKTTVHESCFTCVITHFSKIITCLFAFWWIVALGMLWRILAKCSNIRTLKHVVEMSRLRALTHLGKMLWFTHFARGEFWAARHFQLFWTLDQSFNFCLWNASSFCVSVNTIQAN